jgi:hypothetical protein
MSAPPRPDKSWIPRLGNQQVRDIVYSRDDSNRAVIAEGDDGLVRIHYEFWQTAYWQDREGAYWCPIGKIAHFADSVAAGRKIAEDEFHIHQEEET